MNQNAVAKHSNIPWTNINWEMVAVSTCKLLIFFDGIYQVLRPDFIPNIYYYVLNANECNEEQVFFRASIPFASSALR